MVIFVWQGAIRGKDRNGDPESHCDRCSLLRRSAGPPFAVGVFLLVLAPGAAARRDARPCALGPWISTNYCDVIFV